MNEEEKARKKKEALEKTFGLFNKEESKSPVDQYVKPIAKTYDNFTDQKMPTFTDEVKTPDKEDVKEEPVVHHEVHHVEKEEHKHEKKQEKSSTPRNFPLEKIRENINTETKKVLKEVDKSVSKKDVSNLITTMEKDKNLVFSEKSKVFENLSSSESGTLGKKLDEWTVPQEASEVNASVIVAWLNKTKK